MVVIAKFKPKIDVRLLFPLLEPALFETLYKSSKKVPFPKLAPGSMIDARFDGVVLGEVVFPKPRFFKNSIIIDVSVSQKHVNTKVSKSKIHMCGIKNKAMVDEVVEYVFAYIEKAEKIFSRLTEEHLDAALKYLEEEDENILEGLDKEVMTRLIYYATKCTEQEKFLSMIGYYRKFIQEGKNIRILDSDEKLCVTEVDYIMTNYNLPLGFSVNRAELSRRIDGVQGFVSTYTNTVDHSAVILHPHNKRVNKKKDHPHVTLTVYRSGILTVSGPDPQIIEPIYDKFIRIVEEIKPYIKLDY